MKMATFPNILQYAVRHPVLVGAACIFFLFFYMKSLERSRKIKALGGYAAILPSRLPFGIDFIYRGVKASSRDEMLLLWHRNFLKWGRKANPYTLDVNAAGQRIILTADPENIKAILATQFNDFGKGEKFNEDWHEFLGDSIFSTDHHKWHDSRQLIRPQFVKDRVSDLATFEKHVQKLMSFLEEDKDIDVRDLFFKYTLDAATDFLLGRSVDSLNGGGGNFAKAFAYVQYFQSLVVRTGGFNKLLPRGEFRKQLRVINNFCEPYIEDALALSPQELAERTKSDEGYTFLHAIAAYTRDRQVLRDQLVAVLLAGRDTTACTLSWLFYELGRNPRIVERLRREIADVVGFERAPAYSDLKSMRYLTHTLNEVLRLYPIVPFNVRVSLKDTSLPRGGGPDGNSPVGVLAGTPIGYSTHYMQLRPDLYPPPSKEFPAVHIFSPERWDSWHPQSWNYIPFNGGPRICVGQQFAMTEMAYTVVRIFQKYSHLEGRNFEAPNPIATAAKIPDEEMVPEVFRTRVRMSADIVLMPSVEIKCAFKR